MDPCVCYRTSFVQQKCRQAAALSKCRLLLAQRREHTGKYPVQGSTVTVSDSEQFRSGLSEGSSRSAAQCTIGLPKLKGWARLCNRLSKEHLLLSV